MKREDGVKIGRNSYSVMRAVDAQKHSIFAGFGVLLAKYFLRNIASKKQELRVKRSPSMG
jgi:hypothetical protein